MQPKTFKTALPFLLFASMGLCRAQTACFSTVAEAVAGKGTLAADGYRMESTMRDKINGERWAQVGRCDHPEWPASLVKAPEIVTANETAADAKVRADYSDPNKKISAPPQSGAIAKSGAASVQQEPAVRAGEIVTVAERSVLVQLEVAGVALSNARVGDQVRCRVGNQQFIVGIVQGRGVVEIQ